MEKNAGGEGCDSSYLDRRSRCCAHDKHTPCKQMPCMDYVRKLSSAHMISYFLRGLTNPTLLLNWFETL